MRTASKVGVSSGEHAAQAAARTSAKKARVLIV